MMYFQKEDCDVHVVSNVLTSSQLFQSSSFTCLSCSMCFPFRYLCQLLIVNHPYSAVKTIK